MARPLFTKRHYRVIAKAIHEALPDSWVIGARRQLAGNAARVLRGTNPAFDEARFIEACLDGCDRDRGNTKGRHPL